MIAGHYRLLERIGSGAMGVVWRARDERLERIVAIKQLLLQPGLTEQQREEARKRAMREARIAARLHHPNAIVVFDVAEHEGDPCLVMEYLPSLSLAALLTERGSLPVSDVAALGSQIAAALAAAHASGIVHRDVKPGNVLINDEGVAKITDFGIARAAGDITLTQTGTFAGTPAYLAPEVARGQEPTAAADVFSLGATLYDAVEGGPPFPDRTNQLALLHLVAEGRIQPPKQAGELTPLLNKLLRSEPTERPTMAQTSRMLAELADARSPRPVLLSSVSRPNLPSVARAGDGARPAVPASTVAAAPPFAPPPSRPVPTAAVPIRTPAPAPSGSTRARRTVLVTVIVLVMLLAWAVGWLIHTSNNSSQAGGGAHGSTSAPMTSGSGSPTATTTPGASTTPIVWGDAGQRVVDFYNAVLSNDPASAWAMLTTAGQQSYGNNETTFANYWHTYSLTGLKNAVATPNADGSVNIKLQVSGTANGAALDRTVNVQIVRQNGQLMINTDTRIPA